MILKRHSSNSGAFFYFLSCTFAEIVQMKWIWILAGTLFIFSCENKKGFTKAEDAEDAGREFIRASLDGDYDRAMFYLYKDSADFNLRLLDKWRGHYNSLSKEEKHSYKSASIRPIEIVPSDSSTYSYTYYNSYKKDTTTIRILKVNNDWMVDLRDLH